MAKVEQPQDDDDVISFQSTEITTMIEGLGAAFQRGTNKKVPGAIMDSLTPSLAHAGGYDVEELEKIHNSMSSWHFDLGVLKDSTTSLAEAEGSEVVVKHKEPVQHPPFKATSSTMAETISHVDDDDDDLSSIGQEMLETRAALMTMTRRFDQSHDTFNTSVNLYSNTAPNSPNRSNDLLDERRAARAARLEKVRQRIAKEKEEARMKKKLEEKRVMEAYTTEEARRKRIYEWYCRLGMPSKKELKRKIKTMNGGEYKLMEQDVDLMPWNFSGTLVNVAKLNKLGVAAR